jgi:acetate---CoA ligase (ADP-forming) subunit beta
MLIIDAGAGGDLASLIQAARAEKRHLLSEPESKAFLRAQGIPVPAGEVISDAKDAAKSLEAIGLPVVVKAVAPQLTHKSDAGAVVFPITSAAAAEQACRTIGARVKSRHPNIKLTGFLIEAFRPEQPEWIVALRNDPHFGPAIMFGLGGIFVETLRQVSFRLAPLGDADVAALMSERPATQLLAGTRGRPPADRAALANVLRRLSDISQMPQVAREIREIEINPLVVGEHGALALDALIVLRS